MKAIEESTDNLGVFAPGRAVRRAVELGDSTGPVAGVGVVIHVLEKEELIVVQWLDEELGSYEPGYFLVPLEMYAA